MDTSEKSPIQTIQEYQSRCFIECQKRYSIGTKVKTIDGVVGKIISEIFKVYDSNETGDYEWYSAKIRSEDKIIRQPILFKLYNDKSWAEIL